MSSYTIVFPKRVECMHETRIGSCFALSDLQIVTIQAALKQYLNQQIIKILKDFWDEDILLNIARYYSSNINDTDEFIYCLQNKTGILKILKKETN